MRSFWPVRSGGCGRGTTRRVRVAGCDSCKRSSPIRRAHAAWGNSWGTERQARVRPRLLVSLHARERERNAEADEVVAARRRAANTLRGAAKTTASDPGPATDHAADALTGARRVAAQAREVVVALVPVGAPLADVAVHVKEAPGIGPIRADSLRALQLPPASGAAIGEVAVEVGLFGRERPAAVKRRVGPGPACKLPLGLRRHTIDTARRTLLGQLGQTATELDGVVPGDAVDRQ